MKRGTRNGANVGGVRSKKKGKSTVVVTEHRDQKEEEDRDQVGHETAEVDGSGDAVAAAANEDKVVGAGFELEEWGGLWSGVVDEQMSWGTMGFPVWDMATIEAYNNSFLYHDVLDDYDIWDLKGIQEIPNP